MYDQHKNVYVCLLRQLSQTLNGECIHFLSGAETNVAAVVNLETAVPQKKKASRPGLDVAKPILD